MAWYMQGVKQFTTGEFSNLVAQKATFFSQNAKVLWFHADFRCLQTCILSKPGVNPSDYYMKE
jgi:hypothetical protein